MADVFISYSTGNADNTVQQIADALDRAGISCWYMGRDSRYGRFPEKIAEEIESCAVFLLVLNEASNQSKHVQNEVSLAFENDKELLLFHVDGCKLSHYMRYYLNSFARMDANPPTEQRIQELVEQIANVLGKNPPKIISNGDCGYTVTYTLDENGLLTIDGIGNIWDFCWNSMTLASNAPWWNERQSIFNIRIKNGVTAVGKNTFCDCQYLKNVSLPNSITTIGEMAFCSCKRLTDIVLPYGLASIEGFAFAYCSSLTGIIIPDSVNHIAYRSFADCESLTSVTLPNLNYIDGNAFAGCTNLRNVNIPQRWNNPLVQTLFPVASTITRHA